VTLNDIDISMQKDDTLAMTMVAKTFRYLDEAEVSKQKKEKAAAQGKKGAAPAKVDKK